MPVYHEESHSGLLRHLYLREASATGALMVCLVGNGDELPHSGELVKRLREDLPVWKVWYSTVIGKKPM